MISMRALRRVVAFIDSLLTQAGMPSNREAGQRHPIRQFAGPLLDFPLVEAAAEIFRQFHLQPE
jgi:hypothetical protein